MAVAAKRRRGPALDNPECPRPQATAVDMVLEILLREGHRTELELAEEVGYTAKSILTSLWSLRNEGWCQRGADKGLWVITREAEAGARARDRQEAMGAR